LPSSTIAPPSASALGTVSAASARSFAQSASISLDLAAAKVFGSAPQPVTGSGSFDFASGSGSAQLRQPGGTETVVFLPASVFVKQPSTAAAALPRGKVWISAGLTEYPAISTNFPQFVLQAEGVNPVFLLAQVTWGATSAAPLGTRQVDGGEAQGFQVQVDLSTAAARATGPTAAAFSTAIAYELQALGANAPGTQIQFQSMRVWVDSAERVVELEASPPGSGIGTTTMTVKSFGTPVHVSMPPQRLIVDISSLTPGGERENNGGGDSDGA